MVNSNFTELHVPTHVYFINSCVVASRLCQLHAVCCTLVTMEVILVLTFTAINAVKTTNTI
jgi:hypothetical protein